MSRLVIPQNVQIYKIYIIFSLFYVVAFPFQDLSGLQYFVIGAIAKLVATLLTYPLQIVQSKLRVSFEIETGG